MMQGKKKGHKTSVGCVECKGINNIDPGSFFKDYAHEILYNILETVKRRKYNVEKRTINPNLDILVRTKGNFTIVALFSKHPGIGTIQRILGLGCAKRNPSDKTDSVIAGTSRAVSRALRDALFHNVEIIYPIHIDDLKITEVGADIVPDINIQNFVDTCDNVDACDSDEYY